MARKIGSLFFLLQASLMYASASVQLFLSDMQGNKISQVEVGVPFVVQVVAKNIDGARSPEGFSAWSNFSVSSYGTSSSTTIVNGRTSSSKTFNFVLVAQNKGTFQCAPLSIQDSSGKAVLSDPMIIVVGDTAQVVYNHSADQSYVLQTELDKKTVYVGQRVLLKVRFGYKEPFNDLRIMSPEIPGIKQIPQSDKSTSSNFRIENQTFNSQDFVVALYPEQVGTVMIPEYQASFVPDLYAGTAASLFSLVMHGSSVVQSQRQSLQVKPLPETEEYKNVTAVGSFDSIDFRFAQTQGKVEEGLVAKMKVCGDGNFETMAAPELQLPDGFHYYEGNSTVQQQSNGQLCKEFEWIVQAEQPGTFVIEPQALVYFDPKTEKYKTLQSKSTSITITGTPTIKSAKVERPIDDQKDLESATEADDSDKDFDHTEPIAVSWWSSLFDSYGTLAILLHYLMMILLGFGVFVAMIFGFKKYASGSFFFQTLQWRILFFKSCRKKNMHGVYQSFEKLLSQYNLSMEDEALKQCFDKKQMSEESFDNWKNFVTMIWEMNFAQERASKETDLAISLAKQWFVIILSCCKLQNKNRKNNDF